MVLLVFGYEVHNDKDKHSYRDNCSSDDNEALLEIGFWDWFW